jgi:hypothetical protein
MGAFMPSGLRFEQVKESHVYKFAGKVYHDYVFGTAVRIKFRTIFLVERFGRHKPVRTVLFYPDRPAYSQTLYKVCNILGCKMTSSTRAKPDLVVAFEDVTKRSAISILEELNAKHYVVNKNCHDISKLRVEHVFGEVFGYVTLVDPETYRGLCVMKPNQNAMHKGQVVECPTRAASNDDVVYQRIINNGVGEEVEDIRVPVVGNEIPFVYLKYRKMTSRFSNINTRVSLVATDSVLADHEVTNILEFAKRIGLDYGELDVLRDLDDGRIYIVDVNNTPCGPPNHLSGAEGKRAMRALSNSFDTEFFAKNT